MTLIGRRPSAAPDLGELKLIWLTDSHNITAPTAIRDGGVTAALAEAISWGTDAVVHTGDIGNDEAANVAAAFALLRGSAYSGPIITTIGNHDELGAADGSSNFITLEGANYFNRSAPFYNAGTLTNGALIARWITVDNNFYDVNASDPTVVNSTGVIGNRIGTSVFEPPGGSYRRFGTTQLAWIASTLAADGTSHMLIMLLHYPPATSNPTDRAAFADLLRADGRPALILCGHVHPDATTYSFTTTDGYRTYTAYKAPACQESGAYVRVRVRAGSRTSVAPLVTELTVRNFQQPGGWTINSPFVIG